MKKKIITRKLYLGKKTISILNSQSNSIVAGGTEPATTSTSCPPTVSTRPMTCPKTTVNTMVNCPSRNECSLNYPG